MFRKNYFKGWYFKCSVGDKTIAFIPAYHKDNGKVTYSLQIITDEKVFNISFDSLKFTERPLFIKIGKCIFSEKGISINIKSSEISIKGKLKFGEIAPINYDIMGPFALLPLMQCRHSIFSMKHLINGKFIINGQQYEFQNGVGYIEGDCGYSFPKHYIWTQCCFENCSLMLAVADIPFIGLHFTGIIGIVLLNGEEHRFATYLGAKIIKIGDNLIIVKQGEYVLSAEIIERNEHPLNAPVNGKMSRTIYESASCKAHYKLIYKGKILLDTTSDRASFEFEY